MLESISSSTPSDKQARSQNPSCLPTVVASSYPPHLVLQSTSFTAELASLTDHTKTGPTDPPEVLENTRYSGKVQQGHKKVDIEETEIENGDVCDRLDSIRPDLI